MKRRTVVALAVIIVTLLGVAVYRAVPYVTGPTRVPQIEGKRAVVKSLSNVSVPQHDLTKLKEGIDPMCESVSREVRRSLQELDERYRPTEVDARAIAGSFVRYFRVNRSASLDEALATYPVRGIKPGYAMTQDDSTRAENAWALSTVWARHGDPRTDTISAVPLFQSGSRVLNPASPGKSFETRELATGGRLSTDAHRYTAYAVVSDAKLPTLDGKGEVDASIGFAIVNDRPGGGWDVAEVYWVRPPGNEPLLLPFP